MVSILELEVQCSIVVTCTVCVDEFDTDDQTQTAHGGAKKRLKFRFVTRLCYVRILACTLN